MTLAGILHPDFPAASAGQVGRRATAPWVGQLARFGLVGGGASLVQLATYTFLADSVGSQPANVASWLASTLVATELHRRFSFGGSGSGIEGDHAVGILTSLLTLLLGAAALATLNDPSDTAGVLALVAVNALVGGLRFVVLRWWMVGRSSQRFGPSAPAARPDRS
ncbi:GtrA family protein [Nakamurella sp.]|uniref:GtrA family protein n=1 Tax=Nakamurella sp. TaxID=1869182 RepID=UPI0037830891